MIAHTELVGPPAANCGWLRPTGLSTMDRLDPGGLARSGVPLSRSPAGSLSGISSGSDIGVKVCYKLSARDSLTTESLTISLIAYPRRGAIGDVPIAPLSRAQQRAAQRRRLKLRGEAQHILRVDVAQREQERMLAIEGVI